jgi:hypothetical protein
VDALFEPFYSANLLGDGTSSENSARGRIESDRKHAANKLRDKCVRCALGRSIVHCAHGVEVEVGRGGEERRGEGRGGEGRGGSQGERREELTGERRWVCAEEGTGR